MKPKSNFLTKIILSSGAVFALASGVWLLNTAQAEVQVSEPLKPAPVMCHMNHINTQAQAEALKPGDSLAMVCSKCKHVIAVEITASSTTHIKMLTVGEKAKCHEGCDGSVEVVATGKGKGKDAEVKHVCSKCGDDSMFCAAVKPGSGAMKEAVADKK
jgi:hypothetical protein